MISPLLSNLYLTEVDRMLERAKETTRQGRYTYVEYVRWADDIVILIDAYPRHDWLLRAVEKRLRGEFAKLRVEINEEKSRVVDLAKGESFGFLGFEFRRVRSLRGVWRAQCTPKLSRRTALLRKLKEIFRRFHSQPVDRVVQLINPILRGWVHYFAVGHSSRCFDFIRDWVEKEIRRHLMRARKRGGFGWKRWSRRWLYDALGLFNDPQRELDLPLLHHLDQAARDVRTNEARGDADDPDPIRRPFLGQLLGEIDEGGLRRRVGTETGSPINPALDEMLRTTPPPRFAMDE